MYNLFENIYLETIDHIYDTMDALSNQIAQSLAKKQEDSMQSIILNSEDLKARLAEASKFASSSFSVARIFYSFLDQLESSVHKLMDGIKYAYEAALK